jgi:hypothetical protein
METWQRTELLQEYYACQSRVGQYDQQVVAVKSLGTTAIGALLTIAFTNPAESDAVCILAGCCALVFWYIEALWKHFQGILITHTRTLENNIADIPPDYKGPTIGRAFRDGFRERKKVLRFWRVFLYDHVYLPYLPACAASWLLVAYGGPQGILSAAQTFLDQTQITEYILRFGS